jgi:methylated-DNA-[protein]-cysteine S-methyltransferase
MKKMDKDETGLSAWLGDLGASSVPSGDELLESLDRAYSGEPTREAMGRAFAHLEQILTERIQPPLYYESITNTPVGTVFVAVGEKGIAALDFGLDEGEFRLSLENRGHKRIIRSAEKTAEARVQVRQYLESRRTEFTIPVDLSDLTDFQRQVLAEAARIPRGQVATYGEIARSLGRPKASRAVGRALGSNPVPLIIPCHRVVGSDGSLRGYSAGGGVKSKAFLLNLEGVRIEGAYQLGT